MGPPPLKPVLIVRNFVDADLDAVLALNLTAMEPSRDLANLREVSARAYRSLLEIKASFADGAFLVAADDGRLVGMAGVRRKEGAVFEMSFVRVAHDQQRRGIGRRLVRDLECRALGLGAERIVLDTTVEQLPAQRLYESLGYSITHRSVLQNEHGSFHLLYYSRVLVPEAQSAGS